MNYEKESLMLVRRFLCAAVVWGMASVASATIILDASLQYEGSWDSDWNPQALTVTPHSLGDTTLWDVALKAGSRYHSFGIYLAFRDMLTGQDVVATQFNIITGDGTTVNFPNPNPVKPDIAYYTPTNSPVNPPPMLSSNAPGLTGGFEQNIANALAPTQATIMLIVSKGVKSVPPAQNDYGDYAAAMYSQNNAGPIAGLGELGDFYIGSLIVEDSVAGGHLEFAFPDPNVGKFKLITNNTTGAATSSANELNISMTTVNHMGDSVHFIIPEPGTLVLLSTGLLGLLAYAWRRRRA